MINLSKKIGILLIFLTSVNLQGCAIGVIAAGIGYAKTATAKNRQAYNQYIAQMNDTNLKRQKAGLQPEPVLSYKDYMNS